ncbi:MAG TPA: hypothetical protein VEG84_10430, partial [Thermoanaerobaculia bacterium]|nr:hypothetical protein [Thermoanaerobaculia bacterium]
MRSLLARTELLAALCLAIAGWAVPVSARADEELPRGQIVDKVECSADTQQSYALYLPSGYER